jgi:hypothetical protein
MVLFKSKQERKIERDMQVRQAIAHIRKQIRTLERNERDYLDKARRAKQISAQDQLGFLKQAIRKTLTQRRIMERQLLGIETASQMKNQAESYASFARSLNAVSKSIAEVFGSVDLAKTQKEFETAMARAESMEERMNLFLEMTEDAMMNVSEGESLVEDKEIDALLEADAAHVEEGRTEIEAGLKEIEAELAR